MHVCICEQRFSHSLSLSLSLSPSTCVTEGDRPSTAANSPAAGGCSKKIFRVHSRTRARACCSALAVPLHHCLCGRAKMTFGLATPNFCRSFFAAFLCIFLQNLACFIIQSSAEHSAPLRRPCNIPAHTRERPRNERVYARRRVVQQSGIIFPSFSPFSR